MKAARLTRHFENSPQAAALALQDCVHFCAQYSRRTDDIELALAEAINNVVDHAYLGPGKGTVEINATVGGGLCCTIKDAGRGMKRQVNKLQCGSAVSERGHGLTLMNALATDLAIKSGKDGTSLSLKFPI